MNCQPRIDVLWSPEESPRGLYRRLLFRWPAKLEANHTLPRLRCAHEDVHVDPELVEEYRFVTQSPSDRKHVPLFFPHALLGSAHLQMLSHKQFPLGAIGLLHLRNHVIRYRPFDCKQPWSVTCELTRQRHLEKGLEFDFDSTVSIGGDIVWRSVSTYLKRSKSLRGSDSPIEQSRMANLFEKLDEPTIEHATFGVPHNIGKRYAKATGDYNPIHVSTLAAKLLGFKRAIAHGMWSVARALGELPGIKENETVRHDVTFKGPMFVNSQASIHVGPEGRFDVFCGRNPRPIIVGAYQSGENLITAWPVSQDA